MEEAKTKKRKEPIKPFFSSAELIAAKKKRNAELEKIMKEMK